MPHIIEEDIGQDAIFVCDTSEDIRWFFNGGTLPPNAKAGTVYLAITNITLRNVGDYFCYAKYRHFDDNFLARASLNVFGMLNSTILTKVVYNNRDPHV